MVQLLLFLSPSYKSPECVSEQPKTLQQIMFDNHSNSGSSFPFDLPYPRNSKCFTSISEFCLRLCLKGAYSPCFTDIETELEIRKLQLYRAVFVELQAERKRPTFKINSICGTAVSFKLIR